MTLKAFQKPSSQTPDLEILARAVADYTQQLTKNPTLDGQLIRGLSLTGNPKMVPHNLGRPWIGFIVTYKNTFGDIIATHNSTILDSNSIALSADATMSADIWVF